MNIEQSREWFEPDRDQPAQDVDYDQHDDEREPMNICKNSLMDTAVCECRECYTPAGARSVERLVRHWADLAEVPPSETHRLKIDVERCNGWIYEKGNEDEGEIYLSTHTFYGSQHKHSTKILRECGFNVTLSNWDA